MGSMWEKLSIKTERSNGKREKYWSKEVNEGIKGKQYKKADFPARLKLGKQERGKICTLRPGSQMEDLEEDYKQQAAKESKVKSARIPGPSSMQNSAEGLEEKRARRMERECSEREHAELWAEKERRFSFDSSSFSSSALTATYAASHTECK